MRQDPVERAIALIKEGDLEGARCSLVAHLDGSPDDARGWALLARLARDPGEKVSFLARIAELPEDGSGLHTWARGKLETLRGVRPSEFDGDATHRINVGVELPEQDDADQSEAHPSEGPIKP